MKKDHPWPQLAIGLTSWVSVVLVLVAAILLAGMFDFGALLPAGETAKRATCASNLKMIGLACRLYADDHGDLPGNLSMHWLDDYFADDEVLWCPSAEPLMDRTRGTSAYCYVSGLRLEDPGTYILAFDEEGNHRGAGIHVLYRDRRVEWRENVAGLREVLDKQAEELRDKGRQMAILRPK